jgi:two-component system sensor histidine kinase DegS
VIHPKTEVGYYPIDSNSSLCEDDDRLVAKSGVNLLGRRVFQSGSSIYTRKPRIIILAGKKIQLSRRYQKELQAFLKAGSNGSRRAKELGKLAMNNGLETLDLAAIHGRAVAAVMPQKCTAAIRNRTVKRAGLFFLEVLTPIEMTRIGAVENLLKLKQSNASLRQRSVELTGANKRLKRVLVQHKIAETSLRKSEHGQRILLQESRQMQHRLRHLSHQVLSAQEQERKEISRELHDEVVQTLTGINVQLATLKIEAGVSKKGFTKHISYTQRLVEKSVNIVHQFARNLRPTLLDDLGLIPAIHAYLKAFTERTGLRVSFSAFAGVEKLSNEKRTVLYRVAQAALINTAQHAQASKASVAITDLPNAVLMEVKDDGRSFNVSHVLDSRRNKRLGLIGMRERVEMVGGTFEIRSASGRGTSIFAKVPFKRSNPG